MLKKLKHYKNLSVDHAMKVVLKEKKWHSWNSVAILCAKNALDSICKQRLIPGQKLYKLSVLIRNADY